MGENGAGHPAARAMAPPGRSSESGVSTAKIATPRPYEVPASITRPVDGDWAKLATAPTLLLTPNAEGDDAASTSRIATPAPVAAEDQPWFRTGTTVPPPSMRPSGETVAPPPVRQPPNPRGFKLFAGVIAACLLIVTLAGAKVLYKRVRAPAATATTELATPPVVVATADLSGPAPRAAEGTSPMDPVPAAPAAAAAEAAPRATPVRTSPTRATKPAPRRPPVPKKPARR